MAGEFAEQFDLGGEDSIATVDADGVALAAIQGLSERLDDTRIALDRKDERIDALERDLDRKEARIDDLEARLAALEREQDGGV
jgi:chromosome segregation ATPase